MTETMGQRIQRIRQQKGWSQEQLGRRIDVGQQTIWRLEQGKVTDPYFSTIDRLARVLEVDVHWLVTGEETKDDPKAPPPSKRPSPETVAAGPGEGDVYDPRLSDVRRLTYLRMLASLAARSAHRWEVGLEENAQDNPLIFVGWATEVIEECINFVRLRTERLPFDPSESLPREEQEPRSYLDDAIGEMFKVIDRILERADVELAHIRAGRVTVDMKREAQETERRFWELARVYEETRAEAMA